jgi:two-component system nitrogen regulation sensor histidine kinase NtrY
VNADRSATVIAEATGQERGRWFAYALVALTPLLGIATFLALSRNWPFDEGGWSARVLVLADLVLLVVLGWVVLGRVVGLLRERRRGAAGSRLHLRLAALLAMMAMAPTIVLAAFAVLFIVQGVQAWFSDPVTRALEESRRVALAYADEQRKTIAADAVAITVGLREDPLFAQRPAVVRNQMLTALADRRQLAEAIVVTGDYRVIAQSALAFSLESPPPDSTAIERARAGETVFLRSGEDRAHALVKIQGYDDLFLFVGRFLDPTVLAYLQRLDRAQSEYQARQGGLLGIQINFGLVFLIIALLLLVVAIWLGLSQADRLVHPISALISATERLRSGDLAARVHEGRVDDEFGQLSRAFNRMADQLEVQRQNLVDANRQLDLRRQFTEAVLAGVSSGIIGLDRDGRINLSNRKAAALLETTVEEMAGNLLPTSIPEMAELFDETVAGEGPLLEREIEIIRGGQTRRLLVRIGGEGASDSIAGYVVTFDDVTQLVAAERRAAWADIARRIAHEIKNPLTPIRLSAERLHRKYFNEIQTSPDVFTQCTETIVRQVEDIRKLVDEFSNFARMPAPEFRETDIIGTARHSLFAQQVAYPAISFAAALPAERILLVCDGRQIGQAIDNLLINAAQALEECTDRNAPPEVRLVVERRPGAVDIVVEDNGPGFSRKERNRLTEPYVTTRAKGTGLGLAIVQRIVQEHGGRLVLDDRPGGGARVTMSFDAAARRANDRAIVPRAAE